MALAFATRCTQNGAIAHAATQVTFGRADEVALPESPTKVDQLMAQFVFRDHCKMLPCPTARRMVYTG